MRSIEQGHHPPGGLIDLNRFMQQVGKAPFGRRIDPDAALRKNARPPCQDEFMNTYQVTVIDTPDGPDAALRERLATCAAFRLSRLEQRLQHYPQVGGTFDMLDNFSGPFLWERSDEQMAADPPSRVDYEVVDVDPPFPPSSPQTVKVVVRLVI